LKIAKKLVVPALKLEEEEENLLKKVFALTMGYALLHSAKQEALNILKNARLHAMSALKSQLPKRNRWPLEKIKMSAPETTNLDASGNLMLQTPKRTSIPTVKPNCG
jgi:hypothetical protein